MNIKEKIMAKKRNKSTQKNFERIVQQPSPVEQPQNSIPPNYKAPEQQVPSPFIQQTDAYVPPLDASPEIMNPLLTMARIPGETFQLPSLGRLVKSAQKV